MNMYKILHAKNFRNIMNPPGAYLGSFRKKTTTNTKDLHFDS